MCKLNKKLLAVVLSIVMVISCFPMTTFAIETKLENIDNSTDNSQTQEATIISEITEKREVDKKVFLLSDGTYMAVAYDQPVHYDNNGEWEDYDNTLLEVDSEDAENKDLVNKSSDLSVKLAKKTNQKKFVQIEKDGHKISWYFVDAAKVDANISELDSVEDMTHLNKVSSTVEYKGIYENTDLMYIIDSGELKENIILNDISAPREFEIEYKTDGLTPVLTDSRTISLYNEENEIIYTISAPYMIDSIGNTNRDLTYEITEIKNKKFNVKLKLNSEWLEDAERVYPITVDPLIQSSQEWGDNTLCHSAFISSSNPTLCYGKGGNHYEGSLYVGKDISYGQTRSLIKNPTLPTLGIADKVIHAEMAVYVHACYPELRMDLYRVKENWEQNSVTWNNRPEYDDTSIIDYQVVQHIEENAENADRWQHFEITDLVRGWYSGEIPNYGVLLYSESETSSSQARAWLYSSNLVTNNIALRPVLLVNYRNMSGYEDYWSYTEVEAGRNGKISVNNYNGNLVFAQPLTADNGGNLMPVDISLIYNSNGVSAQFYGNNIAGHSYMARSMQTNYHMYVREDSTTSADGYRYFSMTETVRDIGFTLTVILLLPVKMKTV